jgi:hypothetical protein
MAIFDDTEPESSPTGTTNNYFTQKLGPLPMWGWIAAGVVAYYLYSRYKSSKNPAQATQTATTPGSTTTTDQGGVFVQMEPGATSSNAPTPVPVNTPVTVQSPADVQAQQAGVEYGMLNLVTQAKGTLQQDIEKVTGYTPTTKVIASGEGSSPAYNAGAQQAYKQVAAALPPSDDAAYYKLIGIHVAGGPVSGLTVTAAAPGVRTTT